MAMSSCIQSCICLSIYLIYLFICSNSAWFSSISLRHWLCLKLSRISLFSLRDSYNIYFYFSFATSSFTSCCKIAYFFRILRKNCGTSWRLRATLEIGAMIFIVSAWLFRGRWTIFPRVGPGCEDSKIGDWS